MRIAIVYFGGTPNYSYLLIKSILGRESEVTVFAPHNQKDELTKIVDRKDKFHFFRKPKMRYPTNLITIFSLIRSIETFKPDIIHLLNYYPWMYLGLRRLSKFPLILTVHDPVKHLGDTRTKRVPGSERWFYKYVSQIIVLGEKQKEIICKKYGLEEARINVIYHGNFLEYSKTVQDDVVEKDNCVLFFGKIYRYKGLEYLIQAEPFISSTIPDVHFVVAGTGSRRYLNEVKKIVRNPERFVFYDNYISDQMVAKIFQESSVVALPYVDATQSGVLLMAYSFKKPVVATHVGSLPEYVDDGETGFIVPPRNPEAMARRIIELLMDNNLRKTMGENAYKKAVEEFSWDKVGEQTLEVYQKAHHTFR